LPATTSRLSSRLRDARTELGDTVVYPSRQKKSV
jgi:hypothetical protein